MNFKPNRLAYLTPLEEQQLVNRAKAGLTMSGDVENRAKVNLFTNKDTGAVTTQTGEQISPIQQKVDAAKTSAVFTPTQREDERGNVWETREGGAEVLIKQGSQTPIEAAQSEADKLRSQLGTTTDEATRKILNERLQAVNQSIYDATQGITDKARDLQSQREATYLAQQKRTEDIKTKPGEAGAKIGSQVAAIDSKYLASPEGVSTSGGQNIISQAGIAGTKSLEQAIANDPELANLRNRLFEINTGEKAVADTKKEISAGEFSSLRKFFTDAVQADKEKQKELTKTADEQLGKLLENDNILSAISADPSVAEGLINQYKGTTYTAGKILYSAYLKKQARELELKKALTPKEQIELDTAKANLAKIQAENLTAGQTDAQKAIAGIRAIDSDTTLTQTQKDQLKEKLGFTKADATGDFELKDIGGVPYIFDKRNGSVKNISGTGSPTYTDVGNGRITQQYGATSPLTKDNVPLQSGISGTPGIDFDGNLGDPVRSFVSGTVISVANDPNYGNQVKIQDANGNTHIYSHLQDLPTYLLDKTVLGGDVIGAIGNTGSVLNMSGQKPTADELASGVGSHLDYRVWSKDVVKGSHWADPNSFIGKIDVRSDIEFAISTITKIPAKNRAKLENDVNSLLGKGKQAEAARLVLNAVYDYSTVDEQKELTRQNAIRSSLADIQSALKEAKAKGIDTGIGTYLKSAAGRAAGMEDPDLTKIRTRMDKALQEYRLAISGAAFGVQEAVEYKDVNPSLYAGSESNNAIINSGIDIANSRIRNFFETPLGSKVYSQLKSQLDPQDKFNDSFMSKTKEPNNLKSIKTLPVDVQNKIYDQVEAELNSGTPVAEVKQALIDQGFDPSDFITE